MEIFGVPLQALMSQLLLSLVTGLVFVACVLLFRRGEAQARRLIRTHVGGAGALEKKRAREGPDLKSFFYGLAAMVRDRSRKLLFLFSWAEECYLNRYVDVRQTQCPAGAE